MTLPITDLVPIQRKYGITLYGKVINSSGKLGRYTVYSFSNETNNTEYATYADAEDRYNYLVNEIEKRK